MSFSKEYKTTSFLSENIELEGNLYIKGGIRVDGKIKGILKSDSTIFIGEKAEIEAEITARSLISNGKINGKIVAQDTVKLNKPGMMNGEIYTCNIGIEKDVNFNGRCQILAPQNNGKPKTPKPKKPRKPISNRD
ncbi:MAG: polymer-forming cytoskeletal protein [Deltaproteobacteria bacterium]|jgi:cytoskeletal protein CcmA (bactofilin family)|nr:polymer-forming cytoskeletal protein [Deltaproteobacteria bacterium]MBT4527342.1 polymer-forming cytoskeletal protein [Deltaproteobacteria bacterium]